MTDPRTALEEAHDRPVMVDELVERIDRLLPRIADPEELRGQEMPATAELVVIAPAIVTRIQSDAAEIARLRAEVAEARTKAVADVAAWLRGRFFQMSLSQSDQEYARDIATALETGEWEK